MPSWRIITPGFDRQMVSTIVTSVKTNRYSAPVLNFHRSSCLGSRAVRQRNAYPLSSAYSESCSMRSMSCCEALSSEWLSSRKVYPGRERIESVMTFPSASSTKKSMCSLEPAPSLSPDEPSFGTSIVSTNVQPSSSEGSSSSGNCCRTPSFSQTQMQEPLSHHSRLEVGARLEGTEVDEGFAPGTQPAEPDDAAEQPIDVDEIERAPQQPVHQVPAQPKQDNHRIEHQVLGEGLPVGEMDGIAETAAILYGFGHRQPERQRREYQHQKGTDQQRQDARMTKQQVDAAQELRYAQQPSQTHRQVGQHAEPEVLQVFGDLDGSAHRIDTLHQAAEDEHNGYGELNDSDHIPHTLLPSPSQTSLMSAKSEQFTMSIQLASMPSLIRVCPLWSSICLVLSIFIRIRSTQLEIRIRRHASSQSWFLASSSVSVLFIYLSQSSTTFSASISTWSAGPNSSCISPIRPQLTMPMNSGWMPSPTFDSPLI